MKQGTPWRRWRSAALAVGGSLWLLGLIAGCGAGADVTGASFLAEARRAADAACDSVPGLDEAGTVVVLDWDGGTSPLVPGHDLLGFDTSALVFADGTTKSDATDRVFRQAVLARVKKMLCALNPLDVVVATGAGWEFPDATVVLITGEAPLFGGTHIGQSDFDPCNEYADDSAVIWGGSLATRIGDATFDQWVTAFANVITHEIGHTLGFTHPSEQSVGRLLPLPTAEVMRIRTTVSELLEEQAFLVPQQTCPGDPTTSYRIVP